MPKFTVLMQRYVEETAAIEVDADTIGIAIHMASEKKWDKDLEWEEGDDMDGPRVYSVLNADGDEIWER